ncbi:hypothetical protein EC991_010153 [Linnemannia zychae]|nr:hypothetical protein EC991_010153 [Linnemannia zychae]
MGNKISSPLCVASNNQSVYLAAYDKDQTDGDLVLLRSNSFPASLESIEWELLAKQAAKTIFSDATLNPNYYECAVSNNGAFMILSRQSHSREMYRDFVGAVVDTSSVGWKMVKFDKELCLQQELCEGQLLATPAGSSSPFMLVVQRRLEDATDRNRTLNFLTYDTTGTGRLMEQLIVFNNPWPRMRGDNFEFLGNQFIQLSFAYEGFNSIDDYDTSINLHNTTITSTLFNLDTQGLPNMTKQFNNATLTNYIKNYYGHVEHMMYSWDGRSGLKEVRNFNNVGGEQFSFTPVPASEGDAQWSVVIAEHGNFELGLFGLGIGGSDAGYWQSNKPAKVSAKGLPSDLSGGGIAGVTVGAIALVAIAGFAVLKWRRRSKNKKCDVELSKIGSHT